MTDVEWITANSTEPGHHATAVGDRFKTPSGAEYRIIAPPTAGNDYWTVEKTWLGSPTTFTVAAYSRNSRRYAKVLQEQEFSQEWISSATPEPGNNCTEPGDQWRAITGNVYTVVRQASWRTWQVQRPGMDPITRGLGTVTAVAHRKGNGKAPVSVPRPPVVREVTCSRCGRPLGEWADGLVSTKLGSCCMDVPTEWGFDEDSGTFTRRES